jgi:poly-gamma-glutamate synthesis protein (capsule biosynthesis protein)
MRLLFVGDVMLGRLVNEVLKVKPPKYPWGNTLSVFKKADICFCNLECVISDWGSPWSAPPKVFHFRTDAKNINVLKEAQIRAVSLANNHALDFEYEAVFSMLKALDKEGIKHAGAGADISKASKPAILEIEGKKIALIAFTDNEPAWEAKAGKPGVFFVPTDWKNWRTDDLLSLIRKTRDQVDFLIASAHWGPNWGYYPPPEHITLARMLIDTGADIVYGHSPHVVRGIEIYKKRIIFYSAGDFIDDYAVDEIERNDQSFIFVIETDLKNLSGIHLYPTVIRSFQARMAKGEERETIALRMEGLCEDLGTTASWQPKSGRLEIKVN